jgi:hypothetical protein
VAEPCASSNGSPRRNSCSVLHLNQTAAQHEDLSASPASARASARTQIPCLIRPKPCGCSSPQPPYRAKARHCAAPSGLQENGSYPTQSLPDPPAPTQTDSKYIALHEGGFLQVAVSEAPR